MAGFKTFFRCALILGQQSEGANEWIGGGGEGWEVAQIFKLTGKATKSSQKGPNHTTRLRRRLASNGSSSRTWPCNWCPP